MYRQSPQAKSSKIAVLSSLRAAYLGLLMLPAVAAHAEWVRRVTDGIMGTRITVEIWADDKDKADSAHRCRARGNAPHR